MLAKTGQERLVSVFCITKTILQTAYRLLPGYFKMAATVYYLLYTVIKLNFKWSNINPGDVLTSTLLIHLIPILLEHK